MTLDKFGSHRDSKKKIARESVKDTTASVRHILTDAGGQRITNVSKPIEATDAVNKAYSEELARYYTNTANWPGGYISASKKRLVSVAPPINNEDAVTKVYMFNNALCSVRNIYDAKWRKISNVRDPDSLNDVVTINYLQKTLGRELLPRSGTVRGTRESIDELSEGKDSSGTPPSSEEKVQEEKNGS